MIRRLTCAALFLMTTAVGPTEASDRPNVPEGVVYHETTAEKNAKAKAAVLKAFTSESLHELFGTKVVCGPALWHAIKSKPEINSLQPADTVFNIPITAGPRAGSMQQLRGALFQTDAEVSALAKALATMAASDIHVRKAGADELSLYWALIPYDIEEPLFIVETGGLRFLIDMSADDHKVFWIDEMSAYKRH